ncbi:MAG TPA: GAF domain-containing sensor histidine kinase [Actinomycetota bacterium]|nr:GAF domain-containing sensor histidine kinase [Actinomycetota bacterium]
MARSEPAARLPSRPLAELVESGLAIAAEHDLDALLSRIAWAARRVVAAKYSAVGVVGPAGDLVKFIHSGIGERTVATIGHLPAGVGVLGALLEEPTPLRINEISRHPRSAGFPDGHPVMHSFLGVPITVRGRVYGRLYLTDKQGAPEFTPEDEGLALMLAAQAGVAIENTALYQKVRARGEELAQRLAQLASVDRVGRLLISEAGTDEILRYAAEEARVLTRGTRATLMLLDEETDEMVVRQAVGTVRPDLTGLRLPPGTSKSQAVLRSGRPALVDELRTDPDINKQVVQSLGNPLNGAFAPLRVRDRSIGALAVYGQVDGRPFSQDDLLILEMLANQAAVAVENERLTGMLRELAVLEERERIAKELHDGVIQSIYSVGLSLQGSLGLIARDGARAAQRIDEAIAQLDTVVRDVRNYIFELRPRLIEEGGLEVALRELARELEINTLANVVVDLGPGACDVLDRRQEVHVVQIVREILSNVARHARAGQVRIGATSHDGYFELDIDDDGVGFDPTTVARGQGLTNLGERTEELGGTVSINSGTPRGTHHAVRIPLGDSAAPSDPVAQVTPLPSEASSVAWLRPSSA